MSKAADPYARAGVDIDAGNRLVHRIAPLAAATQQGLPGGAQVLEGVGGFAAAIAPPSGLRDPVLLAATDGVGTKLELACRYNKPRSIGSDVVAMCINDLLCAGATPLFFLDYIACGRLNADFISEVIAAISEACRGSRCALIGGETAEMPGMYAADGFDIAGFAVGVAERQDLLKPCAQSGDVLIALASSGAHSNGYSLIRQLLKRQPVLAEEDIDGQPMIACLLQPTRIYTAAVTALRQAVTLRGLAHITGGGLAENLPRILPDEVQPDFDAEALRLPPLFARLQQAGEIGDADMRRIFNCGVGMVAVVAEQDREQALAVLRDAGERAWVIGHLRNR